MIILSSNFFDVESLPFAFDILFAPLRILIYQSRLVVCEFKVFVHFVDKKSIPFFTPWCTSPCFRTTCGPSSRLWILCCFWIQQVGCIILNLFEWFSDRVPAGTWLSTLSHGWLLPHLEQLNEFWWSGTYNLSLRCKISSNLLWFIQFYDIDIFSSSRVLISGSNKICRTFWAMKLRSFTYLKGGLFYRGFGSPVLF